MKKFLSQVTVIASLSVVGGISYLPVVPATAGTQAVEEMFYTYSQQRINLTEEKNAIGVAFKTDSASRESQLPHLQLQQDLQNGATNLQVTPLGKRYALVRVISGTDSR